MNQWYRSLLYVSSQTEATKMLPDTMTFLLQCLRGMNWCGVFTELIIWWIDILEKTFHRMSPGNQQIPRKSINLCSSHSQ